MKVIIALLSAVVMVLPISVEAQIWNFGAEAGYVSNTLAVSEYESSARSGFRVGADAVLTLPGRVVFESGVAYVRKGAATCGKNMFGSAVSSVKFAEMNYLQIPLMAGYSLALGRGFSLRPMAGGYFAVGAGGHSFVTGTDAFGQPFTARVSTFGGADGIPYRPCNRVDAGLSIAFSAAYRHISLKAGYDLGLANTSYYGNGKQRTVSLSVIYYIHDTQ